jgi:protein-tyrosine-phosphatase
VKRILFVCTGNTCRSQMAETLAFMADTDHYLDVRSAGLYVTPWERTSERAIEALKAIGIQRYPTDVRALDASLIEWADAIVVMTTAHKVELSMRYPEALEYTWAYSDIIDKDIADPYGGDARVYEATATELQQSMKNVLRIVHERVCKTKRWWDKKKNG